MTSGISGSNLLWKTELAKPSGELEMSDFLDWLLGDDGDDENGEAEYGEYGIWDDCPENMPADND